MTNSQNHNDNTKRAQRRLQVIGVVFVAIFLAILWRSVDLMVIKSEDLNRKAKREFERHLNLGAVRGEILDATGERLAASLAVPSVYADASLIALEDRPKVAAQLSEILDLDVASLEEKLATGRKFMWLKRQLSTDEADAIENLNLRSVKLSKEYRRAYPNGELAAHLLGFVGSEGQGLEGLELALDEALRAKQEKLKVKRDNLGRIMVDNVEGDLTQSRGASVVLTIDRRIQYLAEKALANAVETYAAKGGMAVVMNPKTGAVLAAAVNPTFDPNSYKEFPTDFRRNRILTDPFEPGSTFKVFVLAAALEEGIVNPETVIFCENGSFQVGKHRVRDTKNHGDLTIGEIVKYSSNIGSLKVGTMLGNDYLYNYLTRFSFGEKTGLAHLAGEAGGTLKEPGTWRPVEAANIAFGQGLSVTALQMVMAMSAIANDGVLMKPYLVDKVLDADGEVIAEYDPQILRQVISPLTARQMGAMLRMAVQKGGTASRADIVGYPVAGKTGTAQKVVRGGRGYAAGKYVASFLGFAPYHDPHLVTMVVLDEPQNGYYGGVVTTPAFKEIMENSLPLLDLPPSEGKGDPVWPLLQKNAVGAPGLLEANQPTNFIRVKLKKNDRGARGPISFASMTPQEAMDMNKVEPIFADVSLSLLAEPGVMPDLSGLTMRQVLEVMSKYEMDLEYTGSGLAKEQTPPAGSQVAIGQICSVSFNPPK